MHPWELRQRREALEKTPLIISDVFSCFLTQSAPKLIETPAWWVQETWASSCTATRFPNCLPSQARQLSSQYLCISNIITYMIHMCIHIYIYVQYVVYIVYIHIVTVDWFDIVRPCLHSLGVGHELQDMHRHIKYWTQI